MRLNYVTMVQNGKLVENNKTITSLGKVKGDMESVMASIENKKSVLVKLHYSRES